jgi:outer membrane protein insertion porin family
MKVAFYTILFLLVFCLFCPLCFPQDIPARDSGIFISDIRFEGNQGISTLRLKALLRRSQEGRPYTEERLKRDLRSLTEDYLDQGYLHVEVGVPDVQIREFGEQKAALITIPIKEGPLYRVDELSVIKTRVLPSAALIQMCPLKKGDPYSPVKAARWGHMIEETYLSLGHIRARCNIREDIDESGHTVDCTVECEEGPSYRIGKISLVGDGSTDISQLKRKLLMREGGVFNPEMLSTSVQYLNRTGAYKPISYADVQTVIHDETRTVDITFRLEVIEK